MRLLMRHPPSDNFDDVSVVLFLANRAVMGRLTPGQCRSAVDMTAARGGMRYFADTTWKGLEVLLVRTRTRHLLLSCVTVSAAPLSYSISRPALEM